jgi:hypothetical protein
MKEWTELQEENTRLRRENARWYWIGAFGWLVNILLLIRFFC